MTLVSFDAVDQMIKTWMTEVADHPAIHNQGNVLRKKLAALPQQFSADSAIKWVEARYNDYVAEHGIYDPETNATEFADGGEYAGEIEEIIEGLRALSNSEREIGRS